MRGCCRLLHKFKVYEDVKCTCLHRVEENAALRVKEYFVGNVISTMCGLF